MMPPPELPYSAGRAVVSTLTSSMLCSTVDIWKPVAMPPVPGVMPETPSLVMMNARDRPPAACPEPAWPVTPGTYQSMLSIFICGVGRRFRCSPVTRWPTTEVSDSNSGAVAFTSTDSTSVPTSRATSTRAVSVARTRMLERSSFLKPWAS